MWCTSAGHRVCGHVLILNLRTPGISEADFLSSALSPHKINSISILSGVVSRSFLSRSLSLAVSEALSEAISEAMFLLFACYDWVVSASALTPPCQRYTKSRYTRLNANSVISICDMEECH